MQILNANPFNKAFIENFIFPINMIEVFITDSFYGTMFSIIFIIKDLLDN